MFGQMDCFVVLWTPRNDDYKRFLQLPYAKLGLIEKDVAMHRIDPEGPMLLGMVCDIYKLFA